MKHQHPNMRQSPPMAMGSDNARLVEGVLGEVFEEINQACEKHTVRETPLNPYMKDIDRLLILQEEAGEVAEVCPCNGLLQRMGNLARSLTYDEGSFARFEAELMQVAAMAVASIVGARLRQG